MSQRFIRPDPTRGMEADRGYAENYAASHEPAREDIDYRLGYAVFLLLDRILPEGYTLLDVGCGTGGYHRLLQRCGYVLGLDFSSEMVAAAETLKARFGLTHADYVVQRFEDFPVGQAFDAISLIGVYGWYLPWIGNEAMLSRATAHLRDGGIAVFSYVRPKTAFEYLKNLLLPGRTVLIRPSQFYRRLAAASLTRLLEIELPHAVIVLARKGGAERG